MYFLPFYSFPRLKFIANFSQLNYFEIKENFYYNLLCYDVIKSNLTVRMATAEDNACKSSGPLRISDVQRPLGVPLEDVNNGI